MNYKYFFTYCVFGFLAIGMMPKTILANQELSFYSAIDASHNVVAEWLLKRHLDEHKDFSNFATACRQKSQSQWLDKASMDQSLLEEISRWETGKLSQLAANEGITLSTDAMAEVVGCLNNAYQKMRSNAVEQQNTIEYIGNSNVFMDGSLENSDFDIIDDIEKINKIIFTEPNKYSGTKNPTGKSLLDFLQGKKAPELQGNTENNNSENTSENTENTNTNNTTSSGSILQNTHNSGEDITIPWADKCNTDGTYTTVGNMIDANFLRDLNSALAGENRYNSGLDYGEKKIFTENDKNQGNSQKTHDAEEDLKNDSSKDWSSKFPCNEQFCVKFGTNIWQSNALQWGNSFAIESILDKHIEKTNPISWSNLAGQKMNNNSWQLPFLNIKLRSQVSGGAVYMHNTPQVTHIHKDEPENIEEQFNQAYRCAMIEAGLMTDENTNSGIQGLWIQGNPAHTTDTVRNNIKNLSPIENLPQWNCSETFKESVEAKHYEGFSTQINEISSFTDAMIEIIGQIIDSERRLDSVPQR